MGFALSWRQRALSWLRHHSRVLMPVLLLTLLIPLAWLESGKTMREQVLYAAVIEGNAVFDKVCRLTDFEIIRQEGRAQKLAALHDWSFTKLEAVPVVHIDFARVRDRMPLSRDVDCQHVAGAYTIRATLGRSWLGHPTWSFTSTER